MKKELIIAGAMAIAFSTGCDAGAQTAGPKEGSNKEFKVTPGGLEYKIITQGKGTYTPKTGDYSEMTVIFRIGDSLLINTASMNDNKPVPNIFQEPRFRGDLNEGLMLLKEGDSAVFRVSLDSLTAAGQPAPPFAKPGDYASWEVKMVTVKSKADMDKEQAAAQEAQIQTDEKLIQEYIAKHNLKTTRTASGLYYVVREAGTGASPVAGNKVTVNYTGMLLDGTKFDSNVDPAFGHVSPFEFELGKGRVIKGWDEGVALMKPGEKITLLIPSGMAYGQRSPNPKIPANSVMVFDIELISFK